MTSGQSVHGRSASEAERFWDSHYRNRPPSWSGPVDPVLADIATRLPPGDALDVGCAEGTDAIWLAQQGWNVLGIDMYPKRRSIAHGQGRDQRLSRTPSCLSGTTSRPGPRGIFTFINAQYLQTPLTFPRPEILRKAASTVIPGGLILVDLALTAPWLWNQNPPQRFPSPEESFASSNLTTDEWVRHYVGRAERMATGPGGQQALVCDNIIALKRRTYGPWPIIILFCGLRPFLVPEAGAGVAMGCLLVI